MSKLFDFEYQFVKYGEFHANKINQAVHMVFVPSIVWSGMVWLTKTPVLGNPVLGLFPLNFNFVATSIYAAYYITLWPIVGLLATPFLYGLSYAATQFSQQTNLPFGLTPMVAATLVHITGWAFQIFAHQVFEKRSPAILKDPIQPLVLAPLFVFIEALFGLGLFPETSKRLESKVNAAVQKYRLKKE